MVLEWPASLPWSVSFYVQADLGDLELLDSSNYPFATEVEMPSFMTFEATEQVKVSERLHLLDTNYKTFPIWKMAI